MIEGQFLCSQFQWENGRPYTSAWVRIWGRESRKPSRWYWKSPRRQVPHNKEKELHCFLVQAQPGLILLLKLNSTVSPSPKTLNLASTLCNLQYPTIVLLHLSHSWGNPFNGSPCLSFRIWWSEDQSSLLDCEWLESRCHVSFISEVHTWHGAWCRVHPSWKRTDQMTERMNQQVNESHG